MRKLLCKIGIHSFQTVDCTNCFETGYSDRPNWSPIAHMVWYQRCSCCGKRRVKDTVKQDVLLSSNARHNGIEFARVNWVENNIMYIGKGLESKQPPTTPPKKQRPNFKVLDGGKHE